MPLTHVNVSSLSKESAVYCGAMSRLELKLEPHPSHILHANEGPRKKGTVAYTAKCVLPFLPQHVKRPKVLYASCGTSSSDPFTALITAIFKKVDDGPMLRHIARLDPYS
eukprot:2905258-Pleurochrysis_carterae.AAC.1